MPTNTTTPEEVQGENEGSEEEQDNTFVCPRCEDTSEEDHGGYVGDEMWCGYCLNNHSNWCDMCDRYVPEEEYSGDGLCVLCHDDHNAEDEGTYSTPEVSSDYQTREYVSKKDGKMTTKDRTYGVEIECVVPYGNKDKFIEELPSHCGVAYDASINAEAGTFGAEIQTPVLSGEKGENLLKKLCDHLNNCEARVNTSCGLHVHFGAEDFSPAPTVKQISYLEYIWCRDKFHPIELLAEEVDPFCQNYLRHIPLFVNREETDDGKYIFKLGQRAKTLMKMEWGTDTANQVQESIEKSTVIVKTQGKIKALKRLLYFYSVFDRAFIAMLPPSRQNGNQYCVPFGNIMSPREIETLKTADDLDMSWFREKDKEIINSRKGSRYDDSRYTGFNILPLFKKNKTIEIRYHGGTIDYDKIIAWVSLHQKIFNLISKDKITLGKTKERANKFFLKDKLIDLVELSRPSEKLKKYVEDRVSKFTGIKLSEEGIKEPIRKGLKKRGSETNIPPQVTQINRVQIDEDGSSGFWMTASSQPDVESNITSSNEVPW